MDGRVDSRVYEYIGVWIQRCTHESVGACVNSNSMSGHLCKRVDG